MKKIRIGTRGSQLALYQANYTINTLRKLHKDREFELKIIKTEGDRDQSSSLSQIGGTGVFTKAIEDALLAGDVDIAVHSLKDLPSQMEEGLKLGATPPRGPVEDVLVTPEGKNFSELPINATVATGSIRRRSQILNIRPDINIADLRGNIDTRISKLHKQDLDAIIMARAAIVRLELSDVLFQVFSVKEMIPAVGQGAIGIQIRVDDSELIKITGPMNDDSTYSAVLAERSYLNKLDSGCQFPVGAHAVVNGTDLELNGYVGKVDGSYIIRETVRGKVDEAEELGIKLGEIMLKKGADTILRELSGK